MLQQSRLYQTISGMRVSYYKYVALCRHLKSMKFLYRRYAKPLPDGTESGGMSDPLSILQLSAISN